MFRTFQVIEDPNGYLCDETPDFNHAATLWAESERNGVRAKVIEPMALSDGPGALQEADRTAEACLCVLSWRRLRGTLDEAPAWLLDAVDRLAEPQ